MNQDNNSFTNNFNNNIDVNMMGHYQNSNIIKSFDALNDDDGDGRVDGNQDEEYYGSEMLGQQVKMYKLEYFKAMEWNQQMKRDIARLEQENITMRNDCQQHIQVI